MRAAVMPEYGPADVLRVETVPDPVVVRATDVRIAVRAASLNPIDVKIRAGKQRGAIRLKLPWVGGLDVAGEVLEVGSAVTAFAPGDAVMGCPDHRRPGSFAEQVVVDASLLVRKPPSLPWAQAAALPLVGLTAWQCLLPRLAERPGQRVLIQAGAGGVGHVAIQIAKHHGAWVAATCSDRNLDHVVGLGADRAVDYRAERWWETVPDLDVVLDALGGDEKEHALAAVKRGGRVASIVTGLPSATERYGPNLALPAVAAHLVSFWLRGRLRGVDAVHVVKRTRTDELQILVDMVVAGELRVDVEQTYPLADIATAQRHLEGGRTRGKVVVVMG